MSSTRIYTMPTGGLIGTVSGNEVQLNDGFFKYLGGLQDVSGRVAAYVDPSTATTADVVNALIAAKLMQPE
jgi:hypothetical protein